MVVAIYKTIPIGAVQKVKNERHYDEERRGNPLNISTLHLRDCFSASRQIAMTIFWTAPILYNIFLNQT